MIELKNNKLKISFPEVHKDAETNIDLQRTLRIPNDGNTYPLPAGFGSFPLKHVEDFTGSIPSNWKDRGGVMMPIYQSEALWINFTNYGYPMAIKIGTGKINAINGREWSTSLNFRNQDYIVSSEQPWLDGFKIDKENVRQFVAAPLGDDLTVEEQITGEAEFGGIQIEAFPLKGEAWESILEERRRREKFAPRILYSKMANSEMGFGMGGKISQKVYKDKYGEDKWDLQHSSRCFIHVLNSLDWEEITGGKPPNPPITKNEYKRRNIPWFNYYSEEKVLGGKSIFSKLDSINAPEGQNSINPKLIRNIYPKVSEWDGN